MFSVNRKDKSKNVLVFLLLDDDLIKVIPLHHNGMIRVYNGIIKQHVTFTPLCID